MTGLIKVINKTKDGEKNVWFFQINNRMKLTAAMILFKPHKEILIIIFLTASRSTKNDRAEIKIIVGYEFSAFYSLVFHLFPIGHPWNRRLIWFVSELNWTHFEWKWWTEESSSEISALTSASWQLNNVPLTAFRICHFMSSTKTRTFNIPLPIHPIWLLWTSLIPRMKLDLFCWVKRFPTPWHNARLHQKISKRTDLRIA